MTAAPLATAAPDKPYRIDLPAGDRDALCHRRSLPSGRISTEVTVRGTTFRVEAEESGEVLVPTDVGLSLLSALTYDLSINLQGARVLDVGCGSGLYTVAMLLAGAAHVTALDINAACTQATVENVARNGIDLARVTAQVADMARLQVARPWDVVVCNPPHLPSDPAYANADGIEIALVGGADGRALYDVLLNRLDELLVPGGTLLLAHSSLTDIHRTCQQLEQAGYRWRTVQVCELDIPLRRYAAHRDVLLARLYALRSAGRAEFRGLRFAVHTIAATRPATTNQKAGEA